MSTAAAQADAFYVEVLAGDLVFTVKDGRGYPAPLNGNGVRAMPFWSKRTRAQRIIDNVPAFATFEIVELRREQWVTDWLPGLERDGLHVGLNWSGSRATGYDVSVADLTRNLAAREARNH